MSFTVKKRYIALILAAVMTAVVLTVCPFIPFTAEASGITEGAVYEISEDETYVIIIGYSEEFPKITIPSEIEGLPVKEIAKNAFTNNYDLYSIFIPYTVETIGEAAFRNCRSLVSVRLPSGLKALPAECFMQCAVLKKLELPSTLASIGDFCFEDCTKLGKLTVPASVKEIGHDAFVHCENILLDVSGNDYAAKYAVDNNVNTDYRATSEYFWTVMGISVAIALVILFIVAMLFCGYIKRHPQRNPNIFIFRVLNFIYDALSKAYHTVASAIIWLLATLLYYINVGIKWLKAKLEKKKKKPKDDEENKKD